MKLYADLPARRTVQILADVAMLTWVCVWAWAGRLVHDQTMGLAAPGRRLQSAGSGFRQQLDSAGNAVRDVPLVGDSDLGAVPPGRRRRARRSSRPAPTSSTRSRGWRYLLGWVTALVPILIVGVVWLLLRGRFVRRATAAQRFVDSAADLDLFALRAMSNQPLRVLASGLRRPDRRLASW